MATINSQEHPFWGFIDKNLCFAHYNKNIEKQLSKGYSSMSYCS